MGGPAVVALKVGSNDRLVLQATSGVDPLLPVALLAWIVHQGNRLRKCRKHLTILATYLSCTYDEILILEWPWGLLPLFGRVAG